MAISLVFCSVCGVSFSGSSNALYCSGKCKQEKYRASKLLSGFIYKLKRDGEIVYVGQSGTERGAKSRVLSHKHGEYQKVFDDYELYEVKGRKLNQVEADEIMKHKPVYNKRLPSNDTYITVKQFSKSLSVFVNDLIKARCDIHSLGDADHDHNNYIKKSDLDKFVKQLTAIVYGEGSI